MLHLILLALIYLGLNKLLDNFGVKFVKWDDPNWESYGFKKRQKQSKKEYALILSILMLGGAGLDCLIIFKTLSVLADLESIPQILLGSPVLIIPAILSYGKTECLRMLWIAWRGGFLDKKPNRSN